MTEATKKRPKSFDLGKMTIQDACLERLESLGATKSDLANSGAVDAAPSTIFRFFSGRSTYSGTVMQIVHALGMRLVEYKTPRWAK